jgi:ketosteroid isomerase-like protein
MSREDVETVRSYYSAWGAGDLNAVLAVCDADIELLTSGAFPDLAPVYRGHDGMRTFWRSMRAPWESFHLDPERIVDGEGRVVVAVRFRAQGKGSGVTTELRQGHALLLKEGLVLKISFHMSFDGALEAAGLSE